MTTTAMQRLSDLGIDLPEPATPVAAYVSVLEIDGLLYISGQLPFNEAGELIKGKVGEALSLEQGVEAARRCGIMIVAQAKAALGDLERVGRVLKLTVFVNSTADFADQPKIANGASELMVSVFGENGRHTRSAVSVAALPLGVAVEIDAVLRVNA